MHRSSIIGKIVTTGLLSTLTFMALSILPIRLARADLVPAKIYYKKEASINMDKFNQLRNKFCPQFSNSVVISQIKEYQDCVQYVYDILAAEGSSYGGPKTIKRQRTSAITGNTPLSLSATTPFLPFLGNRSVIVSAVPSDTDPSVATALYSVALRRQADCSLTEDWVLPGASTPDTPTSDFINSFPAAQDYLHHLAGLSTTPDTYPLGCNDASVGIPSSNNALLLGTTASGAVISADIGDSLLVNVTDATANSFKTTTLLSQSSNPSLGGFAAADLNGDGVMDLVVAFATDPATQQLATAVFIGNGDGTFKAPTYFDTAGDVIIDDFNGDGKADIVICGLTPGMTTLIGKGDGTFTASALSASGVGLCGPAAGQIVSGDFNGDGKKDLIVHGVVLTGQGDGTFALGAPISSDTSMLFEFGNIAAGDLNKDGKLDLFVSEVGYSVVYYGKGDGTFTEGPRYATLQDLQQVSISDLDGDGNLDVVLGSSSAGVFTDGSFTIAPPMFQTLMGRGDGTFVDATAYHVGGFNNGALGSTKMATGDFDGDGKTDVIVFNASNVGGQPSTVLMLPGDGAGAFGTPVPSSANLIPTLMTSMDANKDGKPDAVLAGSDLGGPKLAVLLNQGTGTFAAEHDYSLAGTPISIATGDFNGDGALDIAVGVTTGASTGAVYVLLGRGDGTFGAPVKIDASVNPTSLAAGDLNGDGRADLIVVDQGVFSYVGGAGQLNGALHVYLGNADGSFSSAAVPTTSATNYAVAALGDMNGDGKLDLIVTGNIAGTVAGASTPMLYALIGKGDGTFQAATSTTLDVNYGIGATSIALADFDHDGHLDVALGDVTAFTSVLLGHGDGTFTNAAMALAQQPSALLAADLNGDGYPELLIGANNHLAVFANSNNWTAAAPPATVATTTALTSSANSVAAGQSVTLTATVTAASGSTSPSGTVTFLDGTTTLGTGTLAAGIATFSANLAAGAHSLTASYGGASGFAASTSAVVNVQVAAAAADFSVALIPTSATASAGQSAQSTVALTPANGFNQTVSLSCSGLPTGATCSFAPASVALNGSPANSTLTIATVARTAQNAVKPRDSGLPAILYAVFAVPLFVGRRRRLARIVRGGFMLITLCSAVALLQGCGGDDSHGGGGTGGTAPGTYTVTVSATAGATTHAATFSLTVS
jgi:Bacterial Ig-like domain (group 3)/FG-GAP-like repeat/FG-GAP repeat